jgi:hypothetical protein
MTRPTLVEFLAARLDEDEADALAAAKAASHAEHWRGSPDGDVFEGESNGYVACGPWGSELGVIGAHIARHDPARVLADVKAKRAIVELHESWPVMVQTPPEMTRVDPSDVTSMTFRMSQQIAWLTTQEYRARFGDEPPSSPMLRALASVYADHPDYDATWAP